MKKLILCLSLLLSPSNVHSSETEQEISTTSSKKLDPKPNSWNIEIDSETVLEQLKNSRKSVESIHEKNHLKIKLAKQYVVLEKKF